MSKRTTAEETAHRRMRYQTEPEFAQRRRAAHKRWQTNQSEDDYQRRLAYQREWLRRKRRNNA
jgi:hypothetical protein